MSDLGLQAYRFSVAWPRVQPDGRGPANRRGLDFYQALVEELLEAGIRPFVTLYHWDLPQALQDRGGWTDRDTVGRYAEYVDLVTGVLGDRVTDWITFNEPFIHTYVGHVSGQHAPGLRGEANLPVVGHHLLLAHGTAVPVVRGNQRAPGGQVGITLYTSPVLPATDRDPDIEAARAAGTAGVVVVAAGRERDGGRLAALAAAARDGAGPAPLVAVGVEVDGTAADEAALLAAVGGLDVDLVAVSAAPGIPEPDAWRHRHACERIRVDLATPTLMVGGIAGADEAATLVLAGRADLVAWEGGAP